MESMKAIILFGHGARDVRWREPFDRLVALWKAQHPDALVQLAFLEMMDPSLEAAVTSLTSAGASNCSRASLFWTRWSSTQ